MADRALVEKIKQGVRVWNEWKAKQPMTRTELLDLSGIDFAEVNVHLNGIDLNYCNLRECNMSTFQAAQALFSFADLQGANLCRTNLTSAHFGCADLSGAILAGTILKGANLSVTNLKRANLSGANLSEAYLGVASLDEAILAGADLTCAIFSQASLKGTDFSSCLLNKTVFAQIDLRETRGLDRIRHDGHVILDICSIYWSNGKIPEQFLRAASVPDTFLALMPTLDYGEEDDDTADSDVEAVVEDVKMRQ